MKERRRGEGRGEGRGGEGRGGEGRGGEGRGGEGRGKGALICISSCAHVASPVCVSIWLIHAR